MFMKKYKDMIMFFAAMIVIIIASLYAGYITPGQ